MILPFSVVNVAQRSPEWQELRRVHLTATDMARLASHKVTQETLIKEKLGLKPPADLSRNPAVQEGIIYEEKLRKFLIRKYPYLLEPGMSDLPQFVAVSRDEPFFMASLDGYYGKGGEVFEFKNIYSHNPERFQDVMLNGLKSKAARDGGWYDQVQWQLICTHARNARLYVHHHNLKTDEHEIRLINLKPDAKRMRELITLGFEFKQRYLSATTQDFTAPAAKTYVYPPQTVVKLNAIIEQYRLAHDRVTTLKQDLNLAQTEMTRLKQTLISSLNQDEYDTIVAGPLTLEKSVIRGTIDPKLMLKAGLDVSKFRGPPQTKIKLTLRGA